MRRLWVRFVTTLYRRWGGEVHNMGRFFSINGELYAQGRNELDLFLLNTRGADNPAYWIWNALPSGYAEEVQKTRQWIMREALLQCLKK